MNILEGKKRAIITLALAALTTAVILSALVLSFLVYPSFHKDIIKVSLMHIALGFAMFSLWRSFKTYRYYARLGDQIPPDKPVVGPPALFASYPKRATPRSYLGAFTFFVLCGVLIIILTLNGNFSPSSSPAAQDYLSAPVCSQSSTETMNCRLEIFGNISKKYSLSTSMGVDYVASVTYGTQSEEVHLPPSSSAQYASLSLDKPYRLIVWHDHVISVNSVPTTAYPQPSSSSPFLSYGFPFALLLVCLYAAYSSLRLRRQLLKLRSVKYPESLY